MISWTIEIALQHWARVKPQNSSWSDLDTISCLDVTASPRSLISDDEISKSGDQDLIFTLKGFFNYIEDGLHNLGHFFFGEAHLLIDFVNDINLCRTPLLRVRD